MTGRLTLQDTMNMVKIKMRLALDTGSQRVCWRVKRIAPYRLALVGLEGTAMVTGRHGTAQAFGPLSQTPFSACPQFPLAECEMGKHMHGVEEVVSLYSKGLS